MLPRSPNLRQMRGVDAKRRLASPSQQRARVFAAVRRVLWVRLDAYDAPKRTVACSALLPVVLSCMSAFDLLIAGRRVYDFIPKGCNPKPPRVWTVEA